MKTTALTVLFLFLMTASGYCQLGSQVSSADLSTVDSPSTTSPSKIKDLEVLGRVWGFLKYYHPAVAKGAYNWDQELFKILPDVLQVKTAKERDNVLLKWIEALGEVKKGKDSRPTAELVKLSPDLNWINESGLGSALASKLKEIHTAKRGNEHHYIALAPRVQNPIFKNEESYSSQDYPDTAVRLLALYRYWNMIQYFFPYRALTDKSWDNILEMFIPHFVQAQNELEYKLAVLTLIAHVQDTHANINSYDTAIQRFKGNHYAPVQISFVENKAVVTDYLNDELAIPTGLKKGDVIDSVNGRSIEEIIKDMLPYMPASNYPTQLRGIARNLLRTNDTALTVVYTRGLTSNKTAVGCYLPQKANIYSKIQKKDTCFRLINSDIAYLYPGTIKNSYLPAIMPEVLNKKGLIIDLRCYPSEFVVFTLGWYLMPKPTPFVKFSKGDLLNPGLFTFTEPLNVGGRNSKYYKGKVVILVNELTQSQAEYTTMAFRVAPNATVIGSTTAGADGNVSHITLPGGIKTMISGIGVYYPDGRETQRVGIVPDIEIKPTIKGIIENRDEVLEKAIKLISES